MNKTLRLEMILNVQAGIYEISYGEVCLLGMFQNQRCASYTDCRKLAEEFVVNAWVDRNYVLEKLRRAIEASK